MIKKIKAFFSFCTVFFTRNKFILINSPLQFINLIEYLKKNKKLDTNILT